MNKSHVSMEDNICIVCCNTYETGAILLDKRLQPSMEHHTITGPGKCPECRALTDRGYIALIAAIPPNDDPTATVNFQDADRTGQVFHIAEPFFEKLFNVEVPEEKMCFVAPEVCEELIKLKELTNKVLPKPKTKKEPKVKKQ